MQSPKLQRLLLASDNSLRFGCLSLNLCQHYVVGERWDGLVALARWLRLGGQGCHGAGGPAAGLLLPLQCFTPDWRPQNVTSSFGLILFNNNSGISNSYLIVICCLGQTPCYGCCGKGNGFIKRFSMLNYTLHFIPCGGIYSLLPPLQGHSCSLSLARLS